MNNPQKQEEDISDVSLGDNTTFSSTPRRPRKWIGVLFVFIILGLFIIAVGVTAFLLQKDKQSNINASADETNLTQKSETSEKEKSDVSVDVFPGWEKLIPEKAEDVQVLKVDFEGDGILEIAVQYKGTDVKVRRDDIREIHYTKVFKYDNGEWNVIKEDEVTALGGNVDTKFCNFEKVTLGNSGKEGLLVSKCPTAWIDTKGMSGYYVFGEKSYNVLDDLDVPKGYLEKDAILRKGDEFIVLTKVEATDDGIVESYNIACESRDSYAGRFGEQSGGFCRKVQRLIKYTANNFQDAKIISDEFVILTKTYNVPTKDTSFERNTIRVNVPVWLTPSEIFKTSHIRFTHEDSDYEMYFGIDLEAITGYLDDPDLVSAGGLSQDTAQKLLKNFCSKWTEASKENTCTISGKIATVHEGNNQLIMLKLFEGNRDSVRIGFANKNRKLNYYDEAVMKTLIDSFDIKGAREFYNYGIWEGEGFVYTYPYTDQSGYYIADEKGLWTLEGYKLHIEPTDPCATCQIPFYEVRTATTTQSLAQHIISEFALPGNTLEEASRQAKITYKYITLGRNDFIKVKVSDLYSVTGYYTKNGDLVVAFRVYWDDRDTDELQDIISTLTFQN